MKDQIKLEKDIAIAVLSTSGLLLTLLVAIIFRSIPEGASTDVTIATLALFLSAFSGSGSLIFLAYFVGHPNTSIQRHDTEDTVLEALILAIVSLMVGLLFLSAVILKLANPLG